MSFNFPNSPTEGQTYTPVGGYQYVWTDGKWRVVESPQVRATAEARNRVVNGGMSISQENPFDVYVTTSSSYPADQWVAVWSTTAVPRTTGVATEPEGKYITLNSWTTVDAAVAAGDLAYIATRIEGIRMADFLWGTASAKPVVLRFTARCATVASLVIGVSLRTNSGSRAFVKNITLTSAWWDFVIPISGDTGGTWPTDTSAGILLTFAGMAGSTYIGASESTWLATNSMAASGVGNLMAVASSRMDIKNVGLYLDADATGLPPKWMMPDEAQELTACQRYYEQAATFATNNTNTVVNIMPWKVNKRASPAVTFTVGSGSGAAYVAHANLSGTYGFYQSVQHSATVTSTVTGNSRM